MPEDTGYIHADINLLHCLYPTDQQDHLRIIYSDTISRIITGKRAAVIRALAGIRRAFPEEAKKGFLFYQCSY